MHLKIGEKEVENKMKDKKTSLDYFMTSVNSELGENNLRRDLTPEKRDNNGGFMYSSKREEIGFPIAHYIGASYNFEGKDSVIQATLGLAGYFAVAHKNFEDFYGSLKGGKSDTLRFNSLGLDKRLFRYIDASSKASSRDIIICPLDSNYKSKGEFDFGKIERDEIMLDSIELARRLEKNGLKGKVDLIVYDSSLKNLADYKFRESEGDLEGEENIEYMKLLNQVEKKYGIEFIENNGLPFPFLLYESLRGRNTDLFKTD